KLPRRHGERMRISPFLPSPSPVSPWCVSPRLEERAGFTTTRRFRVLMIGLVLAVSLLVVWVFEIGPLLSGKLPVTRAEPTPVKDEPDVGAAHIPFDGLLTDVKDGTPFGEVDRSYLHLLGLLERSEKEALPGKGRRVGYQKLLE